MTTRIAKLFAQLSPVERLEANRDRIAERIKTAVAEEDRVIGARQALLLSPDSTDDEIAAAGKAVRDAMAARADLEDAARAIAIGLEDACRSRAVEQERADRKRLQRETAARADRIESLAHAVDQAAADFARRWTEFATALRADGLEHSPHFPGAPELALRDPALRAAGVLAVHEDARASAKMFGQPFFVNVSDAVRRLHSDPLRQAANEIAAGTLPALRPTVPPPPLPELRVADTTTVILRLPVAWRDEAGAVATAQPGECALPLPVAARALDVGAAVIIGSPEGAALLRSQAAEETAKHRREREAKRAIEQGQPAPPTIAEPEATPRDLDVDVREWIGEERARLLRARAAA